MTYLMLIGYVVMCVAAYFLFKYSIRQERNFTTFDRFFSIALSCFGPISLFTALIEVLSDGYGSSNRIVAKKYQKESNAPHN